jgi:hypothetical protein
VPPHDPGARDATAAHLRDLLARVEAGSVEGVFVVTTEVESAESASTMVRSHLSLLGPSSDWKAAYTLLEGIFSRLGVTCLCLGSTMNGSQPPQDPSTQRADTSASGSEVIP